MPTRREFVKTGSKAAAELAATSFPFKSSVQKDRFMGQRPAKSGRDFTSCLQMLKYTHGGTGFMHESFHKDDPTNVTRKWFAWVNTLFGELILKLHAERPHLLRAQV